jgi:hypothetical protein
MVFTVGTGGYFAWKEAVGEVEDDVAKDISGSVSLYPEFEIAARVV